MKHPTKVDKGAARGGTIRTETGPTRENTGGGRQALMGKKMGGGPRDISHSISGNKVKEV